MKEKDAHIDFIQQQCIMYVEKKDGTYGPMQTGSYITKNYLDDFWLKQGNLEESLVHKLKEGEISSVFYYMTLEELSPAELASRVKISKRKVKKHLIPVHFQKIKLSLLKRYADVFNIPVANMFQIIITRQDKYWKSHFKQENNNKKMTIEQRKTKNPFVVVTKFEEKN